MAPAEAPDAEFPLRLTTGRLRDQWHSMTRTGRVARLCSHSPEPEIALHPLDAAGLDLEDGALARISSRRGQAVMKVRVAPEMRRGDAFVAMHWGASFMSGAGTNALTLGAVDPVSKQPELKHAAVRVAPFAAGWRRMLSGPAQLREAVTPLLQRFDYAALSLARDGTLCLEVAAAETPGAQTLAALDHLFGTRELRLAPRGRTICSCFGVGETEIAAFKTLHELQAKLKCGTNCGSCLPELRSRIAA